MFKSILMGQFRHLLTVLGGAGVTAGWMTNADAQTLISAAVTLMGLALSAYNAAKQA